MSEPKKLIEIGAVRLRSDIPERGLVKGATAVHVHFAHPTSDLVMSSLEASAFAFLLLQHAKNATNALIEPVPEGRDKIIGPEES